ncbi:histidine ammonia-lyase/phenylalanine ammonia-lyase [Thermocatellispora tengchongensis]|uniref:Histidine ammonia-lyase/phenylalanine ammonia-lyase n=1 Tax=Thermocatellispora tengchongensis TaxID=1073253 RepID=A0A840P8N4_9ACTN|nr:aromatic amino acid ammonia-lyase [Thermocatellispora tengchongensis]MBB5136028.1 histidine ammonia-lyase/phenylalanine ammonia-lyase [Thermocatellispora tengchongensis]
MEIFVDNVCLDGETLTVQDVVRVSRPSGGTVAVDIAEPSIAAMKEAVVLKRELIDARIPIYGVTTGFGDSCARQIAPAKAAELQRNLILYHLNGVGTTAAPDVTRATMLIRANCLVRGPSAVRPEVAATLLRHLQADMLPLIPEQGSLGASGDLVPLCYVAAALLGEGDVLHEGRTRPVLDALREAGIAPLTLEPKEGLALINGTSFTSAFAALAVADAWELAFAADLASAMTCEALLGNTSHFSPFIHHNKPHPGQVASAELISSLLDGSQLTTSYQEILGHRIPIGERTFLGLSQPIQDKYSVRCAPHVIGVLRDCLEWAERWVTVEINSSTDNPLFDAGEGALHHGGNFYAGHVGHAMDSLKVAVASVADLLDRQMELVVDEKFNSGLTPNLIPRVEDDQWEAGLHHGFKGMQIAASAVTAEALKHSSPATVFSRSTEAHNQDKVSMGTIAARDARTIIECTRNVAAIHLLALAQALDLRGPGLASPAVRTAYELIRAHAPFVAADRRMDRDIHAVAELIKTGALRRIVSEGLPAGERVPG